MDQSNHGSKRLPVPSATSAMACAKASRIMSRYRPIAPKPAPPKTDTDPQSSSSAINDRCSKTSTSSDCSKRRRRSRKRVSEPGTSSKNIKISSAEKGYDQNTASIFSSKHVDDPYLSHAGAEARSLFGLAMSDVGGETQCAPDCNLDGGSRSLRRAGKLFPGVFISEAVEARKFQDSGIGGIAPLASSASESSSAVCNFGSTTYSAHGDDSLQQLLPSPPSAEGSATCIASTSTRKNLVTLSLLPDTPLRDCKSSSAASHPITTLMPAFLSREMPWDDSSENIVQLSLSPSYGSTAQNCKPVLASDSVAAQRTGPSNVMGADGGASFRTAWSQFSTRNGGNPPLIDSSYLEQTYVASSDPVMLTDEHYEILWCNLSFRKSVAERMSRRYQQRGAYIDDLGVPTALASFIFLQPGAPTLRCKAILWGFLKKMVFPKPSMMPASPSVSEGGSVQECRPFPYMPQPVRPISSTICLECITEVNTLFPLPKTLDIAKEQMEQSSLPRLISNTNNRVLWVNSAYKKMVGQHQKQDRLAEFCVTEHASVSPTPATRDVALVFLDDQPPLDATSFSGRVRLHWSNVANSQSITAPCQVKRIHDKENGELLLWTFHVSPPDRMRDGSGMRDGDFHSRFNSL